MNHQSLGKGFPDLSGSTTKFVFLVFRRKAFFKINFGEIRRSVFLRVEEWVLNSSNLISFSNLVSFFFAKIMFSNNYIAYIVREARKKISRLLIGEPQQPYFFCLNRTLFSMIRHVCWHFSKVIFTKSAKKLFSFFFWERVITNYWFMVWLFDCALCTSTSSR